MPAAVLSQSSVRTANKTATHKSRATSPTKKRRVVRRRRRARGELDSDDEIEREAASDSDTGDDDASSTDSVSDDSDTEPASDDAIPHDRTHLPTPRNSKSPESVVKGEGSHLNGGVPSFFTAPGNWSEMVADEKANGPADLPVIEFSDFQGYTAAPARPALNSKKAAKSARSFEAPPTRIQSAPIDSHEELTTAEPNSESNGPQLLPNRSSGQSAREAYQHRLETDPSYVPTIGNFWGHDDRLIDADLRSLSGWWRGRARGRGRGRGFGMRGRGSFQGVQLHSDETGETLVADDPEVPPIERQWGHDGFEDMKRREEQRRAQPVVRQEDNNPKRGALNGARGGFTPTRGRGFPRGGLSFPIRTRNTSPFTSSSRIRFQMKPERMWTKQHEAYLYFDSTLKPRPGQGAGFRIKVPGHQMEVVRMPPKTRSYPIASTSRPSKEGSEIGDRYFVVRIPKRASKEKTDDVKDTNTVPETPIEQVFTVRPELATVKPVPTPEPSTSVPVVTTAEIKHPVEPSQPVPEPEPETVIRSQLEQLSLEAQASDPERLAKTEQAVLRNPPNDIIPDVQVPETAPVATTSVVERPILPPLQTVFTPPPILPQPVAQPSPAYGSPYGYPLPLGIGMDPHGMPFELATGRPVYLQPPPTMYNPRPLHTHMTPGMSFVPGHMHHSSAVSPDFLSQPPSHTPPVNGFIDPSTGTPIFSFPRQTSRIEIRAPMEENSKPHKSTTRVSSSLRTTAPSFQPSRSSGNIENGYYHPSTHPEGSTLPSYQPTNGVDDSVAGMVAYPTYQQSYYYPEPYGYPHYVDMSQAGQYDMYNMDHQTPQGTVYY